MLTTELEDLRLTQSLLRQRMRSLEQQAERAEAKAAMWRGATPGNKEEREDAMRRELAFLDHARRLRARLDEQRAESERLKLLQRRLRARLDDLPLRT